LVGVWFEREELDEETFAMYHDFSAYYLISLAVNVVGWP
jgi:hypothetical protein